jgi:hypothetical protein
MERAGVRGGRFCGRLLVAGGATQVDVDALVFLNFRHKKRRPWTSFFVEVVGRGNLNQLGKSLIYKINNYYYFWLDTNWNTALHLTTRLHSIWPARFVTMIGSELPIAAAGVA